jgi:hypothetical protein
MLYEQNIDTINSAVQARLDDLFEETNTPATVKEPEGNLTNYPLAELKSLVLSIDWEITEELLSDFLLQIDNLGILYKNDQIIMKFFKMLKALGKYIRARQSEAHPQAFNLLNSVFCGLEKMVTAQEMPDLDKQKLLSVELVKYKELQELISDSNRIKDKEAQKKASIIQNPKQLKNDWNIKSAKNFDQEMVLISSKQLNDAIEEIKNFVGSEINSLKEMLVSYQKI